MTAAVTRFGEKRETQFAGRRWAAAAVMQMKRSSEGKEEEGMSIVGVFLSFHFFLIKKTLIFKF